MRLLLADDEHELADALAAILKRSNYSVDVVYDGVDALDYIRTGLYDGCILDIMMPGTDGITVLKTARKEGFTLPVLLLTAKSGTDDKVEGLDSGANDYLTKPFAAKELLARIRAMTRKSDETSPNNPVFGNVTLDKLTFEIRNGEKSIRLANKEYQMLEMLFVNPGHVISTERFMEKIWGYDSDVEINVVWVYISYLRKKLDALDATIQIRAVRNAGYFLEEKA